MKKTRFFLMALLLVTVLVFTGCGRNDAGTGNTANEPGRVTQDVENGMNDAANDLREGVNDLERGVNDRTGNGTVNKGAAGTGGTAGTFNRGTAAGTMGGGTMQ